MTTMWVPTDFGDADGAVCVVVEGFGGWGVDVIEDADGGGWVA